ncbi:MULTISPECIES: hypothetical protein [unclassified Streptomyces]|uniref:hypothetical protein n=1 Tax=unclassified Streptomyces TaxID=2593676 RepID=UPI002DDB28E7|nr:hypothetical protein [Streptomyces sp. NBC_00243]WRZ22791.1 hypothetical protein OHT59_32100 [Streptomyces sp. NBC_00243]
MNTELVVASVSSVVALVSVLFSARASSKQTLLSAELDRQASDQGRLAERQDVMSRHRDPLLWAAYDLQSRLYNIVDRDFLRIYYAGRTDRDRAYARRSTLHVLAEYLGQVEILRRRIQFLDLGNRRDNRLLVWHFTKIGNVLNNDGYADRHFQVFRSDQRAMGEVVIRDDGDSCLGYAEFCQRLESDPEFATWFEPLVESIHELAATESPHLRLVRLQVALMDLIDFLDPEADRFPDHRRGRLSP